MPRPKRIDPYQDFQGLSRAIGNVNSALVVGIDNMPCAEKQGIHRVNDVALIVLHVFAFEDLARHYVQDKKDSKQGKQPQGDPRSPLLSNINKEAKRLGKIREISATLKAVDEIIMIRNLYAHCLGRRKCLHAPKDLQPGVLKSYGFETDGGECDMNARWWPTRFESFRQCINPLKCLAKWMHSNLPLIN